MSIPTEQEINSTTSSMRRRRQTREQRPDGSTSAFSRESLLVKELLEEQQKERDDLSIPSVPPAIVCSDAASVDSSYNHRRRFNKVYECPPVVNRSTILAVGLFIFGLAMIWPPLILLFTYIASKLIPYTFRENDDAAMRRELYSQFVQDEDHLPDKFVQRFQRVDIEESYWTNERCVPSIHSVLSHALLYRICYVVCTSLLLTPFVACLLTS